MSFEDWRVVVDMMRGKGRRRMQRMEDGGRITSLF